MPRLWSAHFGLLDDGHVLRLAPLASYSLYPGSGRFVPGYTLFYATVHAVVGTNALRFFLVNYAVVAGITAGLIELVRLRGGSAVEAWAAGMFFVLSGPTMENLFTLSKAEPMQVLWLVVSLLLAASTSPSESWWRRAGRFAATTAALLLAMATKETAVVMIPISVGWLAVGWWFRDAGNDGELAVRTQYVGASVLAGAVIMGLRVSVGAWPASQGFYGGLYRFEWESVRLSIGEWMVWLVRDFAYLAPLIAVIGVLLVRRRSHRLLLLDCVLWMAGWMGVYLPWSWIRAHYLLPFALGAAALSGVAIGEAFRALRDARSPAVRGMVAVGVVIFLLLWPVTVANHLGDAAIQLAVDAANHDLIRFAATLPAKSVLSVSMPNPSEYVYEIGVHLSDLEGRPDVTVGYFDAAALDGGADGGGHYAVVPRLKHGVMPSFRSWVTEEGAAEWDRALTRVLGSARDHVYGTRRHVRLLIFNLHRPMCEWWRMQTPYCRTRSPFIDTRVLSYGWDVYRIPGTRPAGAQTTVEGGEGRDVRQR